MTTLRQLKQQDSENNARANKRIEQLETDVVSLREEVAALTRVVDAMNVEEEVVVETPTLSQLTTPKPGPKKSTK